LKPISNLWGSSMAMVSTWKQIVLHFLSHN
jgi:hypothetical protein